MYEYLLKTNYEFGIKNIIYLIHIHAYNGNFKDFYNLYKYFLENKSDKKYWDQEKYNHEEILRLNNFSILNLCIARGIMFNLNFAIEIYKSDLKFNKRIFNALTQKFIINNILVDSLIENFIPIYLWIPEIPNKETCLYLLNKYPEKYKYQIAIISIIKNWEDIYLKTDIKPEIFIVDLCQNLNRKNMYQDQIIKSKQHDGFYYIMDFSDEIYYTNTTKKFEKTSTDEVKNFILKDRNNDELDETTNTKMNERKLNFNEVTAYDPHELGIYNYSYLNIKEFEKSFLLSVYGNMVSYEYSRRTGDFDD